MRDAQFPSDYEWALLDRWLKGLIDTNAEHEHEARLVMAIAERYRLVANPNIKAALEARFNYIDATVESVTEIVAAALTPGDTEQ